MDYFVTAPLVITRAENGSDLYLYQGAPLPSHVKAEEVARLKADKLIGGEAAAVAAESGSPDAAPAKSAPKDEWVAYAESKGDSGAADKTKEQLIADHGDN